MGLEELLLILRSDLMRFPIASSPANVGHKLRDALVRGVRKHNP